MFFGELFAIAGAFFAVTANGSPIEVAERELQARSLGNVHFCNNTRLQAAGNCGYFSVDSDVCYNVPADFNDNIDVFDPDEGIGCWLYIDYGCNGGSLFLTYPGNTNLSAINFRNTSSFECVTSN